MKHAPTGNPHQAANGHANPVPYDVDKDGIPVGSGENPLASESHPEDVQNFGKRTDAIIDKVEDTIDKVIHPHSHHQHYHEEKKS